MCSYVYISCIHQEHVLLVTFSNIIIDIFRIDLKYLFYMVLPVKIITKEDRIFIPYIVCDKLVTSTLSPNVSSARQLLCRYQKIKLLSVKSQVRNELNTKLSDLLYLSAHEDASFWPNMVTNIFFYNSHKPLNGEHIMQIYRPRYCNLVDQMIQVVRLDTCE